MSKQNNTIEGNPANENAAVCCFKCGRGLELVSGTIPQHMIKASHQGKGGRICKASGTKII